MRFSSIGQSNRGPAQRLNRSAGLSHGLETLESRTLLSDTPLPALADLEDPTNAVIRFETTYGDIDIELFSNEAPLTVINFLTEYVLKGKLDTTFFHRDTDLDNNGDGIDILQGGGFYFDDTLGVSEVDASPAIDLENVTRENVARTIAMARTFDPNSATSQFFLNVDDNSDELGSGFDGGYVVFGRVIQGWDVVTEISALNKNDISDDAPIAGSPIAGNFAPDQGSPPFTPTNPSYNSASNVVREQDLVYIINAEVIKQGGSFQFFAQKMVYPEGNRTDTTTETINLYNPNAEEVQYQIIVRYEYESRETVISRGRIDAGKTLAIPLSIAGQAEPSLVRVDSPYAIIVESAVSQTATTTLPLAASATRTDFRATTSEEFFNVTGVSDSTLRTWDFARVERNELSREFLTWVNLSDTRADITLTFYTAGAAPITATYAVDAFRRGGAEVFNLNGAVTLADGVYGVRVTSTQNIVVQLSDWDIAADGEDPSDVYTPGWSVMGTPGGTSTIGAFSEVQIFGTNHTSILSFVNPGNTAAVVTLSIWRTSRPDGTPPIQRVITPLLTAEGRTDYALTTANLGIPEGERFSVTYSSGAPIAAQYTSVNETNRNLESPVPGDSGVSTSAIISTAGAVGFANASLDPTRNDGSEVLNFSLFNPFASSDVTFNYTLEARFSDGATVAISSGSMTPNARLDVRIDQNSAIRTKVGTDVAFRSFTLVLRGTGTEGSNTYNVAGYGQLTRLDITAGTSMTTQGALLGDRTSSGDAIFAP